MDEDGRIQPRRRCVQFQVVIIQPGQSSAQAVESQDIPIEEPVPKSRGRHGRNPSSVDQSVISDAPEGGTHVRDNTASANESASGTAGMPGKAGGELSKKFKTDASLQSKAAAESFAGPENTTSLVGYDDGYGQEQSEQQQPQQQRQQEQQQPLRESQPPANAAGVSGTLNLSGSNPSVSASAKPLPPVPGDPKPAAAAQDQAGKLARPVSRLFREKRETFVFASVVAGNKTKKIQVSSPQGTKLLDVNLKKWDDRSRIQVADLRPMSSMAGLMFEIGPIDKTGRPFVPVKGAHKLTDLTFSVSMIDNGGVNLGSLKFESDIKLIIAVDEPTNIEPHVSSPIQHISNTKLSASGHSTASIPDDAPVVALTGDFKSGRYILVKKMAKSREQRLFGECKGRHLARKTVLESHWLTSVDIDEADINPIVLSAVVLICMVPPA
ncbi:hypothetical protein BC831DRAFT_54253 [Entophlyctis helioformis]|nr:hypothetical protein BC831DRAFT_54253 [Entophlyctis helioformis]